MTDDFLKSLDGKVGRALGVADAYGHEVDQSKISQIKLHYANDNYVKIQTIIIEDKNGCKCYAVFTRKLSNSR